MPSFGSTEFRITAIVGGILVLVCLTNWRRAVLFVFLWMSVEDTFRKILPGRAFGLYLLKDVMLIVIYVVCFFEIYIKKRLVWRNPLRTPLLFFLAICIVQALNPLLPNNILVPILGLKGFLLYIPLLYVGYWVFRSDKELIRFCRILIFTTIPITGFAIAQTITGPQYWERYWTGFDLPGYHIIHSFTSGNVNLIASTFVSATRMSRYLLLILPLGLGMVAYSNTTRGRTFAWITVIASAGGILLAGKRMAVVVLVFMIFFVSLFAHKRIQPYSQDSGLRRLFTRWFPLPHFMLMIPLLILIILFVLPSAAGILRYQYESWAISGGEVIKRRGYEFTKTGFSLAIKESKLIGRGIGVLSLGVRSVGYEPDTDFYVTGMGFAKIMVELGIVGLIIFGWLHLRLFYQGYRVADFLKRSPLYILSVGLLAFQIGIILYFWSEQQNLDMQSDIFRWFWAGVLLGLPRLLKKSSAKLLRKA